MDTKSITAVIVGLMVSGLILVSFIPIFTEVTATEDTFDNTPFARYQMKPLEEGDEWVRADGTWTYNGETLTTNSTDSYSIVFSNNEQIRENGTVRGVSYINNSSTNNTEVVVVDESLYLSINSNNVPFNYGYGAVQSGDYVMKTYESSTYVNSETEMTITGNTALGTSSSTILIASITGSIADGFTVSVVNAKNSTVTDITVGEVTVNAETVEGYLDLYKFTSVSFDVSGTDNDNTLTKTFTYSTFVVPKEVTAEKSVHGDDVFNTVINIIPLLAGVGLLMAGVYYFISRK